MSAIESQPTGLISSSRLPVGALVLAVFAPFAALGLTALPVLVEAARHALGR
jgi:hypothetical protein